MPPQIPLDVASRGIHCRGDFNLCLDLTKEGNELSPLRKHGNEQRKPNSDMQPSSALNADLRLMNEPASLLTLSKLPLRSACCLERRNTSNLLARGSKPLIYAVSLMSFWALSSGRLETALATATLRIIIRALCAGVDGEMEIGYNQPSARQHLRLSELWPLCPVMPVQSNSAR